MDAERINGTACAGKAGEVQGMKVSCNKGVASHVGPESCVDVREGTCEALTGESAGRVLSLENVILRSADAVSSGGRQQRWVQLCEDRSHSAWSQTPRTHRSISQGRQSLPFGSREISGSTWATEGDSSSFQVRAVNPKGAHRR